MGAMYVMEREAPYYHTYRDFLEWDETDRCELINGETYMLAAPSLAHQDICGALYRQFAAFLDGKPCRVFFAPVAVRLRPKKDHSDDTVLEPDIIVVCDPAKLDGRSCNGPPDLVVEILSPSTAKIDRLLKFNKYLDAGVREYWMVDGDAGTVEVCILDKDRYVLSPYDETETIPVGVLPGCTVDLSRVFPQPA